ncbi:hypothetical protein AVV36_gp198 [Pectobacterium bacteriophage PM2]|uniref:Uncharacterized protein n=1 Tax=Pectobacterium bacteriophage PM2 TaxID=1429794 RepID=A0A0A0Q3L8_9CAUD|nr:hypothetical protein AVV36_gp198 [Pectobacterium bacteriophage PM2]AHY25212.1 hypothetical protein PM2_250 [Pectobacterium bacteriophage PM2]
MNTRLKSKSYNIYAVYNNGEEMKSLILQTMLNEVPPNKGNIAMYLEGYRLGVESIAHVEVEFEFEEIK